MWINEHFLEEDGSKTWMRRGDDTDIGFVPRRRGKHMCEHMENESIWINSWDRGCARCPLGWPHATTCVRAWRQFLHHYRLLGTGEFWQQELDGAYPYENSGTLGQADLRSVQMHKQWNRRLMRMRRRARSMIREPGRATGGWNMLPLDLAVEEDFGLRPEVIDVSYVNGSYDREEDSERREIYLAGDEWKGHVLPCHNQMGVHGFPVITADMPHGCHRYGRPLARKDRIRAGTLLPGPLESSQPERTPLHEANVSIQSDERVEVFRHDARARSRDGSVGVGQLRGDHWQTMVGSRHRSDAGGVLRCGFELRHSRGVCRGGQLAGRRRL